MKLIRKLQITVLSVILLAGFITIPAVFANNGECILTLTKTDNADPVILPNDTVTYHLTLKNTGTAKCTGGGVKLRDTYDANLTYVSHSVIPVNYPSSQAPLIDAVNRFIELNFATMYPGDTREVDIVFKVKTSSCGYTAKNKAKYYSDQTGWSQFISEMTTVSCAPAPVNNPPIITLIGPNPIMIFQNSVFADPGATAFDPEDGNITANIVMGGFVNTATVGSYTRTYDVNDSQNVSAVQVTRIVKVVPASGTPTQCSDSANNDGDSKIDSQDAGCHTDGNPNNPTSYDPNDNLENTAPIITVLGQNPFLGTAGDLYADAGATANDAEDGNITAQIITSGTIATSTTLSSGTFTVSYSVTDSGGLSDAENRSLTVQPKNNPPSLPPPPPPPTPCAANCGGGESVPNLIITDEKIIKTGTSTATVTWTTNLAATSRIVYGQNSRSQLLSAPNYGYQSTNNENLTFTTSHAMIIENVDFTKTFFSRPISKTTGSSEILGIELSVFPEIVSLPPPLVLGATASCEEYLLEYLRIGHSNNPNEVRKLQTFLRDFEGFANLQITGVFDQPTFAAVSAFQLKYRADILEPWALPDSTGYVYYTTRKKINEIYCQREFPLNTAQIAEIEQFKSIIKNTEQRGISAQQTVTVGAQGQVGLNQPSLPSSISILSIPASSTPKTSAMAKDFHSLEQTQPSKKTTSSTKNAITSDSEDAFSKPELSATEAEFLQFTNLRNTLSENKTENILNTINRTETNKKPPPQFQGHLFASLAKAYTLSLCQGLFILSFVFFLLGLWSFISAKRKEKDMERKLLMPAGWD